MVYEHQPRRDRFQEPSPTLLRKALPTDARTVFDACRRHLGKLPGVTERVAWYGQSWCWSIEYRAGRAASGELLAVIIPAPDDLQLAMPVDEDFATTLPQSRLKRAVRDGLVLGLEPFDTRWGVWSLHPGNLLDDLRGIVDRRLDHIKST